MNRKGATGDQLMVFTFFFLAFLIAIGLFTGIYIFYGTEYEFRQIESDILNYKIRDCVLENTLDDNFKENFFEICDLNEGTIVNGKMKARVCVNSEDCRGDEGAFVSVGGNFQSCFFEGVEENDNYPKCTLESFMKDGERVDVITGSNQGRRLK